MNEFTAIAVVVTLFVLRFVTPVLVIMATATLANHWLDRFNSEPKPPQPAFHTGD